MGVGTLVVVRFEEKEVLDSKDGRPQGSPLPSRPSPVPTEVLVTMLKEAEHASYARV